MRTVAQTIQFQQGPAAVCAQRSLTAARRDVILAGKLLAAPIDDRAELVAAARVAHPDWTWRQIGEALGIGKWAAFSLFRRRCIEAGLR